MRKMMIMVAALGIGWATQGCKKNEFTRQQENSTYDNALQNVKCIDGVLHFERDDVNLTEMLILLSGMDSEKRIEWEKSIGFKSLLTQYEEVMKIEQERMEEFFHGVPDSLTTPEYEAMGLFYKVSDEYRELEKNKIIKTIPEELGFTSTNLEVSDFELYLSNGSKTAYGGKLKFEFDNHISRIIDTESGEILYNDAEKTMSVQWRLGFPSWNGSFNNTWFYETNNRRYKAWVRFTSYCVTNSFAWLHAMKVHGSVAEERRWGTWQRRDDYRPLRGFIANYNWQYQDNDGPNNSPATQNRNTGNFFAVINQLTLGTQSYSLIDSPISWGNNTPWPLGPYGPVNWKQQYLKPSGQIQETVRSTNWRCLSCITVTDYNYILIANGCGNGCYHTIFHVWPYGTEQGF